MRIALLIAWSTAAAVAAAAETTSVQPPTTLPAVLGQPMTEPRAAVNPADPDRVLVAAIVAPVDDDDTWDCALLASADLGASWTSHRFGIDRCIDPWIEFLSPEDVVFAAIRIGREGEGTERLQLVFAVSNDGGASWSDPVVAGRNYEHPILLPDGPSALVLSRRGDSGNDDEPRHFLEVGRILPDGRVYWPLTAIHPGPSHLTNSGFVRGADGRLAAAYVDFGYPVGAEPDPARHRRAAARIVSVSLAGDSGTAHRVTRDCAGHASARDEFAGYPYLAAGGGRLHHACVGPDHAGIRVTSTDDIRRWPPARRVDAGGTSRIALTPMLAANEAGAVLVAWQDRSADTGCQRFTVAVSADGGRSYSAPTELGRRLSCPAAASNGRAGRSWPGGGDYSSVAVDSRGRFHVAWAETLEGRYRLEYAVLEVR